MEFEEFRKEIIDKAEKIQIILQENQIEQL